MATSTSIEALWAATRKTREDTSPTGMIRAMYGTTSRGGPDTRAAAEDLGVSQRTVQRWLKSGLPRARSAAADALTGGYQAWRNTAAARRSQLSTRRESRLRKRGTTMVFYGKIAVSADPRNTTRRSTTVDISAANMNRILDATLAGDDDAAHAALEDAFGEAFGGSVSLDISSARTFR